MGGALVFNLERKKLFLILHSIHKPATAYMWGPMHCLWKLRIRISPESEAVPWAHTSQATPLSGPPLIRSRCHQSPQSTYTKPPMKGIPWTLLQISEHCPKSSMSPHSWLQWVDMPGSMLLHESSKVANSRCRSHAETTDNTNRAFTFQEFFFFFLVQRGRMCVSALLCILDWKYSETNLTRPWEVLLKQTHQRKENMPFYLH